MVKNTPTIPNTFNKFASVLTDFALQRRTNMAWVSPRKPLSEEFAEWLQSNCTQRHTVNAPTQSASPIIECDKQSIYGSSMLLDIEAFDVRNIRWNRRWPLCRCFHACDSMKLRCNDFSGLQRRRNFHLYSYKSDCQQIRFQIFQEKILQSSPLCHH